jgi:hypothetical protein
MDVTLARDRAGVPTLSASLGPSDDAFEKILRGRWLNNLMIDMAGRAWEKESDARFYLPDQRKENDDEKKRYLEKSKGKEDFTFCRSDHISGNHWGLTVAKKTKGKGYIYSHDPYLYTNQHGYANDLKKWFQEGGDPTEWLMAADEIWDQPLQPRDDADSCGVFVGLWLARNKLRTDFSVNVGQIRGKTLGRIELAKFIVAEFATPEGNIFLAALAENMYGGSEDDSREYGRWANAFLTQMREVFSALPDERTLSAGILRQYGNQDWSRMKVWSERKRVESELRAGFGMPA